MILTGSKIDFLLLTGCYRKNGHVCDAECLEMEFQHWQYKCFNRQMGYTFQNDIIKKQFVSSLSFSLMISVSSIECDGTKWVLDTMFFVVCWHGVILT